MHSHSGAWFLAHRPRVRIRRALAAEPVAPSSDCGGAGRTISCVCGTSAVIRSTGNDVVRPRECRCHSCHLLAVCRCFTYAGWRWKSPSANNAQSASLYCASTSKRHLSISSGSWLMRHCVRCFRTWFTLSHALLVNPTQPAFMFPRRCGSAWLREVIASESRNEWYEEIVNEFPPNIIRIARFLIDSILSASSAVRPIFSPSAFYTLYSQACH